MLVGWECGKQTRLQGNAAQLHWLQQLAGHYEYQDTGSTVVMNTLKVRGVSGRGWACLCECVQSPGQNTHTIYGMEAKAARKARGQPIPWAFKATKFKRSKYVWLVSIL